MRFCFLFSIILLCTIAKGQDTFFVSVDTAFERQWKDCEFTGIINVDTSLGTEKIVSKVRQWFSEAFVSAKSVLDNVDFADGVLYGKGNIPMKLKYDGIVSIILEVRCKADRIKYTISNLNHKDAFVLSVYGTPAVGFYGLNSGKFNYGSICQEKLPKGFGYGATGRGDKEWQRMRDYTKRRIFQLIQSLKDTMSKEAIKSKDDW
jgi:hypothetical protein